MPTGFVGGSFKCTKHLPFQLRVINLVNTCGISASTHEKNCADRRSHRYKKESFCFTYVWAYFRRSYGMRGRRRKGNRTCALSLPPPLPGKSAEHDGWERERNLSPPSSLRTLLSSSLLFSSTCHAG